MKKVRIDYRNVKVCVPSGKEALFETVTLTADEGAGTVGPLRKWLRLELNDNVRVTFDEAKVIG